VPTGSSARDLAGPVYLDASALAKIYLLEPGSEELDRVIRGRRDLLLSDLAVTEVASALSRRQREGTLAAGSSAHIHHRILDDAASGLFEKVGLDPDTHRQAERLLLAPASVALRAADALHLALAATARAATIATFDGRLARAAREIGLRAFPDSLIGR
jgi:predicted nucleic acid-binding protein